MRAARVEAAGLMVRGLGLDLCDVDRLARSIDGPHGATFRKRVFSPGEQAYCDRRKGRARLQSYAARFAAKEAVMKVLGTGWGRGVGWQDVEIVKPADGPPRLALTGGAARHAERLGMTRWHLSLTHTDALAAACVAAEGDGLPDTADAMASAAGRARPRGAAAGSRSRRPTRPR